MISPFPHHLQKTITILVCARVSQHLLGTLGRLGANPTTHRKYFFAPRCKPLNVIRHCLGTCGVNLRSFCQTLAFCVFFLHCTGCNLDTSWRPHFCRTCSSYASQMCRVHGKSQYSERSSRIFVMIPGRLGFLPIHHKCRRSLRQVPSSHCCIMLSVFFFFHFWKFRHSRVDWLPARHL